MLALFDDAELKAITTQNIKLVTWRVLGAR